MPKILLEIFDAELINEPNILNTCVADSGCGLHGLVSQPNECKSFQPPEGRNVPKSNIGQGNPAGIFFSLIMKKENRGGPGRNQGAKPKYNEPTTTIAFRCPVSKVDELKEIVQKKLFKWSIKKNP